ncbi:MAG: cytochrome c, partial [Granulosicoccus sp.]
MFGHSSKVAIIILWASAGLSSANSALDHYDQPWEICALCHSLDGNSHMAKFPKLAGQPSGYLQKQLHDFLQGKRTNDGGQMSAIVTEIDVEDISRIADWFASQPAPPAMTTDTDLSAGRALYDELKCADCHSSDTRNKPSAYAPYLTSQHAG